MVKNKCICVLDERGREVLDPTPVSMPVGFKRPMSIQEQIRILVKTELSRKAHEEGNETFDEADDFVIGDEPELRSRYELDDEQERYREEAQPSPGTVPPKPPEDQPPPKAGAADDPGDQDKQ